MSLSQCGRILFPVDFSDSSAAVAPFVRAMAMHFHASVTVLHAFHLVRGYDLTPSFAAAGATPPAPAPYTPNLQQLRVDYRRHLEDFARTQFEGIDVCVEVEDGDPAGIIEWVAERAHSDLIMMPTKGLGRFRRLLLGSVCAKVLHDIHLPVWTSAHSPDRPAVSGDGYRSIVCAIEMNAEAESVVKSAAFLAKAFGSRLCVVHMGSSPGASVREAIAGFLEPGINARARVLETAVVEGIRQAAFEEEADLIVLGRGHITNGIAPVWSRLYTIVCGSSCPVLSV